MSILIRSTLPTHGSTNITRFEVDFVGRYLQRSPLYQNITFGSCFTRPLQPTPSGVAFILMHYLSIIRGLLRVAGKEDRGSVEKIFFSSLQGKIESCIFVGKCEEAIAHIKGAILALPQSIERDTSPALRKEVTKKINTIFEYVACSGCDKYIARKERICPSCGAYKVTDPVRPNGVKKNGG